MSQEAIDGQRQAEANNPATSVQRLEILSADPSLRSIVAGNPAAPVHLLERLVQDKDGQVRKNVASNPNTPWPVLEHLAWEFPHEFLHNPVVPLQLVTHPAQVTTDTAFWDHLLWEATIPPLWWNWLRSYPASELSPSIRLHVQYAGEAIHPFGVPEQEEAQDLLTLVELLTVASDQSVTLPTLLRNKPADQPLVTIEQLLETHFQWLAATATIRVRQAVAGNERTPVQVLLSLVHDQKDVRE